MRTPDDMPGRPRRPRSPSRGAARPGRNRAILIAVAIALFVLLTSLRGIASFYTDYLWFDSVGQTGVWRGVLGTKIALAAIFIGLFFVLLYVNLFIADRIAPRFRPAGPEEDLIERYHEIVGGRTGLVRAGVALVFAIIAGAGASGMWNEWLLFRHRQSFGTTDPQFGKDVGFYVFQLPFLNFLAGWLFGSFVVILIVSAVAHYMNGGIRVQTPVQRVTPQVKAHLSVLLAILALIKLYGYYLQQFSLTTSTRGVVDGATYTDVRAQLPAIRLLLLISAAAAVLFIVNIWRRGWVLPVLGLGLWLLIAIVAGGIVPALMQKFRVEPSESTKERAYIERNISATRQAFGLDDQRMTVTDFAASNQLTTADIVGNAGNLSTIDNIRLWDPDSNLSGATFDKLQRIKGYYRMGNTDVDRYMINGRETQVLIAARELNTPEVPQQSWQGTHLAFTHGYGVVVSPSNAQTSTGQPSFVVRDVPLSSEDIKVDQPGIYFGEGLSGYVIVGTNTEEVDFERPDGSTQNTTYAGADGIKVGGLLNKAAFALRFLDFNPLVSGNISGSSKILINRDIRSRLDAIAPFLSFDGDPYPAVVDGRIKWIVDAYTTTDQYPYAQRATTESGANVGLTGRFNYARNSVKAVIDAYDGTVQLFVIDKQDPIIRAYQAAFPSLFSVEDPSPSLASHFRYPEELFRVQTNMWARYHLTDPIDFYNQNGGWTVAPNPGQQVQQAGTTSNTATAGPTTTAPGGAAPPQAKDRIPPFYVLMQVPGESEQSFVLLRSFVPVQGNSQQMTAFITASGDPDNYGKLQTFRISGGAQPPSPTQAASTISADSNVAQLQTLLGVSSGGSDLNFGNLITVPINKSLLYVRPVYVQATGGNSLPLLRKVVVEFAGQVAVDDTLGAALRRLTPFRDLPKLPSEGGTVVAPPPTTPGAGGSPPTVPSGDVNSQVSALLTAARQDFRDANAALASNPPNYSLYGQKLADGQAKVDQAQALLAASVSTPAPATTTTGPPPTSAPSA